MSKQQVQARTRSTSKSIAKIRAYQRSKELEHKIEPPKIQELVLKQREIESSGHTIQSPQIPLQFVGSKL